ncbi:hypothetical protein [Paenibacillus sp. QZ-Y1]|uniref:hypothetical protein n=1 Tax=Paenibacillus sp. QZ-Y1 TaxID=3414511 RepID=UPI003F79B3AF
MKKFWIITGIGVVGFFLMGLLFMNSYVRNTGVENVQMMYKLSTTDQAIGFIGTNEYGNGIYLTKKNLPETVELLQSRMAKQGWTYVNQDGSGHFFEKEDQTAVITTTIWQRKYKQISVQHNVVNIADPAQ